MFPSGRSGLGLLLLRLALASELGAQGGIAISAAVGNSWRNDLASDAVVGALRLVCAFFIGIGFLTPAAQIAVVIVELGVIKLMMGGGAMDVLLHGDIPILNTAVALGLALIGPGAYSIDARIFGRRKIVIPARSPMPASVHAELTD